jgi:hypothetical protein
MRVHLEGQHRRFVARRARVDEVAHVGVPAEAQNAAPRVQELVRGIRVETGDTLQVQEHRRVDVA